MILPILHYGNPILRKVSEKVTKITPELLQLSEDLIDTLYSSDNGVGLSAVQVGYLVSLIVVDIEYPNTGIKNPIIMFNTEILCYSGISEGSEGCLSVPGIFECVSRPENIECKYLTKDGVEITINANGFLSRCIQHEVDHCKGILFVDKLSSMDRSMISGKLKQISRE